MTGNERRMQRRAQSKKAHLIRYLWMFIAATAAVLGADQLMASPDVSAHIEASALTNAIIYRLDVAVIDSSQFARPLRLVIESQFGDQSREIPCGASEGAFEGLRPNTLYTLRVVVDQGFGDQSIAKTTVRTQNALSGGLTVFFDTIDYGHGEELVTIDIDALWNDPMNEIIDLRILYAVVMPSAFDPAMFDDPLLFETATLELANPTLMLGPYFNSGQMLLLVFEASTPSGTHRLETRVVDFPMAFDASLYVQNAGPDSLDIAVYAALPDGIDATFDVELWNGSTRVATLPWTVSDEHNESDAASVKFNRLAKTTLYTVVLIATYRNPTTGLMHRVVVQTIEAWTTPAYTVTIVRRIEGDQLRFTVRLDDPNHVVSNLVRSVFFEPSGTYQYELIDMIDDGNHRYVGTFTVLIPAGETASISILADLQANASTTYFSALLSAFNESGGNPI